MRIVDQHTTLASFVAIGCLVAGLGDTVAGQPRATELSPGEQKEYELIQERLRNQQELLSRHSWTLVHCADEKEIKAAERTLNLLQAFYDTNQIAKLIEAGGVKEFKSNAASLLKNKDPVVRGFGAVLLAVIGDAAYKSDIAKLLADKRGPPPKEDDGVSDKVWYNFDRNRAAVALGLMGAKEYAPRLSALLRSRDPSDRAGAAEGLGYMGAKEYASTIAKLLSDDDDQVQTAALRALAELGAVEYAKDISGLLTSPGDPSETAIYALARLNAKEQASKLAALLHDEFRKRDASKALALLGAKEYTKDIAQLIEDDKPLVRCDALIGLGILDAKEYVTNVAAHLQDNKPFVRAHAAVALLLMGDQTNAKEIVEVVRTEWKLPEIASDIASGRLDTAAYFRVRIKLHPVVAERRRQLTMRAVEAWERLNRSETGLQPGGPAKGSQPIGSETNRTPSPAGPRR
jgi:HEAT repeat protein